MMDYLFFTTLTQIFLHIPQALSSYHNLLEIKKVRFSLQEFIADVKLFKVGFDKLLMQIEDFSF